VIRSNFIRSKSLFDKHFKAQIEYYSLGQHNLTWDVDIEDCALCQNFTFAKLHWLMRLNFKVSKKKLVYKVDKTRHSLNYECQL